MSTNNRSRSASCGCLITLLKPQYRGLLRCSRKKPHLFRVCGSFSLIAIFAACLCAAAYLHKVADEILQESPGDSFEYQETRRNVKRNGKSRPSISLLKRVLEQRGVVLDHVLEREEIEALIDRTGQLTNDEMRFAEKSNFAFRQFHVSTSPDTALHAKVASDNQNNHFVPKSSPSGAESFVFDSEASFVERVDDNKDSVWLLSVVAMDAYYSSNRGTSPVLLNTLITDEIWGRLVHRYTPFGFKMGLINCHRLRSLCHERGLIAADLILALPKGGDRIKDSVQYRAFPKQSHLHSPKLITNIVLQQIHNWVASVLAERVRQIQMTEDVVPGSVDWAKSAVTKGPLKRRWIAWLTERPKPIHVIWMWNQTFRVSNQITDSALSERNPSLVLSALSVPFTGRVRFWITESAIPHPIDSHSHRITNVDRWAVSQSTVASTQQLFKALDCPKNSTFLILTPEAKCFGFGTLSGEYLSYPNLELYLRLLYPSVDDVLLASFFLLNLLVLLNTVIRAGKILAYTGRCWMGMSLPYTREQLRVIQSFIRLARQGWTLHRPTRVGEHTIGQSSLPNNRNDIVELTAQDSHFSIKKLVIQWGKSSLVEFLSCNLVLLLTVLPVINALSVSHAACILNLSLWILRLIILFPPVVSLRLSIIGGHFSWLRFSVFLAFCCILILISATHVYFVLLDVKPSTRLRRRTVSILSSRRMNRASPDELLTELTRSLLISDLEPFAEQTTSSLSGSSSSSLSEIDPIEFVTQDHALRSNSLPQVPELAHTTERARLLRRLGRLHELLREDSQYLPSTSIPFSEDTVFEAHDRGDYRSNQRAAPAHIYTWQCARSTPTSVQTKEESLLPSGLLRRKSRPLPRFHCENMTVNNESPAVAFTEADYEAGDEEDESTSVHLPNISRQTVGRRMRCRRHRFHFSQRHDREGSSSDSSIPETLSSDRELPSKRKQLDSPIIDWPPWVIPCEECVVCWRMFRPGVRLGALPCGHGFHEACIRRWLDTGAVDCPVCRWPAHAPHLRQQRQMIGQLLSAVQSTLNATTGHVVDRIRPNNPTQSS